MGSDFVAGDRVEVWDGDRNRWCPGTVQQWWTAQALTEAKVPHGARVLVVKSDNEFEGHLPLTWAIPDYAEGVAKVVRRLGRWDHQMRPGDSPPGWKDSDA